VIVLISLQFVEGKEWEVAETLAQELRNLANSYQEKRRKEREQETERITRTFVDPEFANLVQKMRVKAGQGFLRFTESIFVSFLVDQWHDDRALKLESDLSEAASLLKNRLISEGGFKNENISINLVETDIDGRKQYEISIFW
jgi:predicted RNA-binding protein with PIN domain